jgi:hypothetical protein
MSTPLCPRCNERPRRSQRYVYCKECRAEYERKRYRMGKARNHKPRVLNNLDGRLFVVEHDPLSRDEGGFPRGAQFNGTELKLMLSYGSLLPGTVLSEQGGGRYCVTAAGLVAT